MLSWVDHEKSNLGARIFTVLTRPEEPFLMARLKCTSFFLKKGGKCFPIFTNNTSL